MTPRLKISKSVISRLGTVKKASTGSLFGLMYENTLLVVGFNIEQSFENISTHDQLENTRKNYKTHMHNFPTEVDLCGLITFAGDIDKVENHSGIIKILEEVDITDNPLLMVCTLGSVENYGLKTHFYVHDKLVKVTHEVVDENTLLKEFVCVRVQSRLPLVCELESHDIQDALQSLYKKVASGTLAFSFANNIYLTGGDTEGLSGVGGLSGDSTTGQLYKLQVEQADDSMATSQNRKRYSNIGREIDVLNGSLLMKPTRELRSESQLSSAPIIQHIKKTYECLHAFLHVDALSMVARSAPLADLYAVLVESVCRNLKLTERCLLQQFTAGVGKPDAPLSISLPQLMHFLPPGFSHFVTLALPESYTDEQLAEYRKALHQDFALPVDRPLFRKGNAYPFRSEQPGAGLLVNPHEHLGPSGVRGGQASLVRGLYSYHHYMQDRMDDNGWGCAYRSLQTIVSWYRWQGYTARAPPTHREVQECLVQLGDKPSSFIGSRQWIGSTEVSFCLESMLGVTSRILSVSSGEELGSHGGELAQHFKTHGTPIMIGGGVLAHTILGVDYNRSSGELKFLILDPHYTGSEDLSVVLTKGWCGWKGLNFWAKNAFYNLCLPQRAHCV